MDKLNICLSQHGSAAQDYIDRAILLNDEICLLPKFGFPPSIFEAIEKTLEVEKWFGKKVFGRFVVNIQLFAKPATYTPTSKDIDSGVVQFFFELGKQCLNSDRYLNCFESSWYFPYEHEEGYILDQMKDISQFEFIEWFKAIFFTDRYDPRLTKKSSAKSTKSKSGKSKHIKAFLKHRDLILAIIIPKLFGKQSDKVLLFPLNNGQYDEHYSFVPYVIIGQTCLMFIMVE
ncbi:MAG: hypothetical protein F6K24_26515 [Okeania sp. SIO2D1]|nr:hypothetical protein [Okeania sp. SIO2D1]